MQIRSLVRNDILASNCYILIYGNRFSVIDPSSSYNRAIADIPELADLTVEYVILTHAHIDHIWGINSYTSRGATVLVAEQDSPKLSNPNLNCASMIPGEILGYFGPYQTLKNGDIIRLGDDAIEVVETPGHTSGSLSYVTQGAVFTGDTLFSSGYGRYDLPTGNVSALLKSLKKLLSYPDDYIIYSGHGVSTLIKYAKMNF